MIPPSEGRNTGRRFVPAHVGVGACVGTDGLHAVTVRQSVSGHVTVVIQSLVRVVGNDARVSPLGSFLCPGTSHACGLVLPPFVASCCCLGHLAVAMRGITRCRGCPWSMRMAQREMITNTSHTHTVDASGEASTPSRAVASVICSETGGGGWCSLSGAMGDD